VRGVGAARVALTSGPSFGVSATTSAAALEPFAAPDAAAG